MKKLILIILVCSGLTGAQAQLFSLVAPAPANIHQIPDAPRVPDAPTF
jgi:hypothetical protein